MSTEMMNWYKIPGFGSYDINYYDKTVRSCKHFNIGFHIMKETNGKVTIVDDYGNSKRMSVEDLYNLTFNSGVKLEPRGEYDMYCGGMQRVNRKKHNSKVADGNHMTLSFGPNGINVKPF